jgi:hypothetical protein
MLGGPETEEASMTETEGSDRDTKGDDQLEEAEAQVNAPDEADDELAPTEGAETKADLDEEGGQANRPGTERPPV